MRSLKGTNQNDKIRVAVRVRPPLEREISAGNKFDYLKVDQDNKVINAYNVRNNAYKNAAFDILFDHEASQGQIFADCGCPNLIKQVVSGYNSTIFAYGQTGSGKTFSMEGYKYGTNEKGQPVAVVEAGENEGIVPRSIRLLFEMIKQEGGTGRKKFTVYCSYLQVYKERVYDLLNKSHLKRLVTDGPGLKLKWNKDHFQVENLYTFECRSAEDVLALYHFGIKNKVVASHNMNNASSRSHSMLKVTLEQIDGKDPDNTIVSALQLVDLAGSERQSQTGNVTSKESIDINKSLLTLRQVITALTERKQGEQGYIPYRDSKLTCLLRQSLGGNSFTLMMACLNPCDAQMDENLSTLSYASKASFISNKPVKNEDPKTQQISDLKRQVKILTEELANANETISFLSSITGQNPAMINKNLGRVGGVQSVPASRGGGNRRTPTRQDGNGSSMLQRQDSAVTQKADKAILDANGNPVNPIGPNRDEIDQINANRVGTAGTVVTQGGLSNNAANETKDAITGRIIHTVNMMKEVLQGNLGLRETIQKQSELIDNQNAEIFQLQNENEDLRERLMILEDFTGKDSLDQVQHLVREKKTLEKRVAQLEQTTSTGFANSQQKQRSTMTNFAKRSMLEQNMVSSIPSDSQHTRTQPTQGNSNTFDDDYEPVRPSMKSGHVGPSNTNPMNSNEVYNGSAYDNLSESGEPFDQTPGSRQGSSIGMVNRQARVMAQQNYRMSQGQSRKSNQRSIYDNQEAPSGIPMPVRGTTTDRGTRSSSKNAIALQNHPSNQNNQYYMVNGGGTGTAIGQRQGNIIPMQKKKASTNSNYAQGTGGGGPQKINYVGSMNGSLQDKHGSMVDPAYQKSPMLNTGKKLSNSQVQRGFNNRSSAPHSSQNMQQANQTNQSRTAANWMKQQNAAPLSPSRNTRELQKRMQEGQEAMSASQQSSYSRHDVGGPIRGVHSPQSLKMIDSASDFNNQQLNISQPIMGQQSSTHKRGGAMQNTDVHAYQQYQQSRMPMVDNEEPDIPQFQVSSAVQRGSGHHSRVQTNQNYIDAKKRSQLPNI